MIVFILNTYLNKIRTNILVFNRMPKEGLTYIQPSEFISGNISTILRAFSLDPL